MNVVNSLLNKTSSGFDGLSTKNLKFIFPYISCVLLKIINKSLMSGVFPDILKIARVLPLHKGGSLDKMINFRPISILSSISKIFERLIFNKMYSFIEKYQILRNTQFGFRKGHNTELAVMHTIKSITDALDKDVPVIGLFVDISKAFDSVDHNILLDKLYLLGYKGVSHSWFKSYLTNRYQHIELAGVRSYMYKLTTGVPQGSILGPLLFLLYVDDLTRVSKILKFTLFADDTTVLYSDRSLKYSLAAAENEISIVAQWFIANRLLINIDKTHFMFFARKNCVCNKMVLLNDCMIQRVHNTKFLIHIDGKLSWSVYISKLRTKLSKSLGMLRVVSHCMPRNVLKSIFYALFYSQLTYGTLL